MFTHTLNFKTCNLVVCFRQNLQKSNSKFFLCQNRKSEFSIDGLIISVTLLTFGVQKFLVKWVKKCTLSALLNFTSLNMILLLWGRTKWWTRCKWIFFSTKYDGILCTNFILNCIFLSRGEIQKGAQGTLFDSFTKRFCRFLTPKVKSGTDMINPSIESSDFLFWHKNNFEVDFWKFCRKQIN